jgi:nucleoside-diphosphate-sugar epimerase
MNRLIENKRILVTGVTGLIGRALAHVLAPRNHVYGAARFVDDDIAAELSAIGVEPIRVDFSERQSIATLPRDCDVVFNMAVKWGYDRNASCPAAEYQTVMHVNALLAASLMRHYAGSGAKLVMGSTGGVYPEAKDRQSLHQEDFTACAGGNVYSDSKIAGEQMVRWCSAEFDVPAVVLRYYWPITPFAARGGGGGGGRIATIAKLMREGKPVIISEAHPWLQNLGYISDITAASVAAVHRAANPAVFYNVTGEELISSRTIAEALAAKLGVEPVYQMAAEEFPCGLYIADVGKMKRDLWVPRVGLGLAVDLCLRGLDEGSVHPQDWMFEYS